MKKPDFYYSMINKLAKDLLSVAEGKKAPTGDLTTKELFLRLYREFITPLPRQSIFKIYLAFTRLISFADRNSPDTELLTYARYIKKAAELLPLEKEREQAVLLLEKCLLLQKNTPYRNEKALSSLISDTAEALLNAIFEAE